MINDSSFDLPAVPQSIYHKIQSRLKRVDREKVINDIDNVLAKDLTVSLSIEDLEEAMGGPFRSDNLDRACQAITSAPMYFKIGYDKDGNVREDRVFTKLVGTIIVNSEGLVAEFTPTQLQLHCFGYYTEYREELTSKFKTAQTFRIFDHIMKLQNTGKVNDSGFRVWTVKISLVDLHWKLRSPKSYMNRYSNFRVNVLDKAEEEINATEEIKVSIGEKRVKRKVIEVIFRVTQKMVGPIQPIEIPMNDEAIKWLDNFSPTKSQLKIAWEWYIVRSRVKKLHDIYSLCKTREARTDLKPIKFDSYFWSMVDQYRNKDLGKNA